MESMVTCFVVGSTRTRILVCGPEQQDRERRARGGRGRGGGARAGAAAGRHDDRLAGLSYAGNDDREEVGGGARRPGQQEAEQSQHRYSHRMQTGGTPTPCGPLTSHQLERIMRYSRLKFDERDPGRALPLDSVNGLNHTTGY